MKAMQKTDISTQVATLVPAVVKPVTIIVVSVLVFMAVSTGFQKIEAFRALRQEAIRNEAIDTCAKDSRYVYTQVEKNITRVTEEPSQGFFMDCLKLKNIK